MASGKGGHFLGRRQRLSANNRAWMNSRAGRHRKVHTRQKRIATGLVGTPQGGHTTNKELQPCRCGRCSTK